MAIYDLDFHFIGLGTPENVQIDTRNIKIGYHLTIVQLPIISKPRPLGVVFKWPGGQLWAHFKK
ncbi:MAG: hypothetical protein ABW185_27585, partial [Sedimenticola sp.]